MRYFISVLLILFCLVGFAQEFISIKNQSTLLSQTINCLDSDEFALWVGSNKGINRIELKGDSVIDVSARQTSKPVLSICNDNKYLWVGIAQKGLYLFNKRTYIFKGKFKIELGSKDIVFLEKTGKQLYVQTKSKESYVIDLSDTTIKSTKLDSPVFKEKIKVLLKGSQYKASDEGVLVLTMSKIIQDNNEVQDTALGVTEIRKKIKVKSPIVEVEVVPGNNSAEKDPPVLDSNSKCSNYLWILVVSLLVYSFIFFKLVSYKYKKDIKVLEDEILKKNNS
ncbi:MAG: hypothetical protein ACJA0Q_000555 [Saprospiraceae bacterium]|jgi:hypothetical protein